MSTPEPQQLLDELHEIGIEDLYWSDLSAKERAAALKVTRQKLRLVKQHINQQKEQIRSSLDGRKRDEKEVKQIALPPYNALSELVAQIEIHLATLEAFSGSVLPPQPTIGTVIAGDTFEGSWVITTPDNAKMFLQERLRAIKRQIPSLFSAWAWLILFGGLGVFLGLLSLTLLSSPATKSKGTDNSLTSMFCFASLGLASVVIGLARFSRILQSRKFPLLHLGTVQDELKRVESFAKSQQKLSVQPVSTTKLTPTQKPDLSPLDLLPEHSSTRDMLRQAVNFVTAGDYAAAQKIVTGLVKSDPNNADVWYMVGYLQSDTARKRQAYQKALTIDPQHARAKEALTRLG